MMRYEEAERFLLEIPRFTKKNRMEDTKSFLHLLGDPDLSGKIIHVAGTNGKGSVCAYLASVFEQAGYRVGLFTSPHLVTMRERFRLNGEMISEMAFIESLERVMQQLRGGEMENANYHPTFFEMLFFMAMLWFQSEGADIMILETGLGGRLDATNSVSRKELCVITEIGLDHIEYLGDTIPKIAGEKAGILQAGVPVVFADTKKDASRVILERAKALSCPAFPVSKGDARKIGIHKNFIDFSYNTRYYGYVGCTLNTCAHYQIENAALAVRVLDVLGEKLPVSGSDLTKGLQRMHWEGRMEEILPGVYADGAHNADGIRAFLETVKEDGCCGRRFLLFSAVQEKQYREIIRQILASGQFDEICLTKLKNTRGLSSQILLETYQEEREQLPEAEARRVQFTCAADCETGLLKLLKKKQKKDVIYIAGSLYLVGESKAYIKRKQND